MKIHPVSHILGKISVPGDKSISHRAVIFSSLQKRPVKLENLLLAEDVIHHLEAFKRLGHYTTNQNASVMVNGVGLPIPNKNYGEIDLGNSGTAIRLLSGLFAGSPGVKVSLVGDSSLMQRPMRRIVLPLEPFGAHISLSPQNTAPIQIEGQKLQSIAWSSDLSSAQVKSACILAGIASNVSVEYIEPLQSRDHTERFLEQLGITIYRERSVQTPRKDNWHGSMGITGNYYKIIPPYDWEMDDYIIPGDISSAAFFLVLAALKAKEHFQINQIGLNPSRIGIIDALTRMGADIQIMMTNEVGEPVGDLSLKATKLNGTIFEGEIIPNIIDEIPILAVAAAFADGVTEFRGVADLRNKESDRITAVCSNLSSCGVKTEEWQDGFKVYGQKNVSGGLVKSFLDHRIAMAFAVLGMASENGVEIDDVQWVNTSFPGFFDIIKQIAK